MRKLLLALSMLSSLAACGGNDSDCAKDEVRVEYLGGSRNDEYACKPRPAVCGDPASCSDMACIAAMYDYCEAPYYGVGCSDTFEPPIISCNP